MTNLTLEEQERRAFANGDPDSSILTLALDGDETRQQLDEAQVKIKELEGTLAAMRHRTKEAVTFMNRAIAELASKVP